MRVSGMKGLTRIVNSLDVVDEESVPKEIEDFSQIELEEATWKEIRNQDEFDTFEICERNVATQKGWKRISTKLHITVRHGELKARFVAREFRGGNSSDEFFAATTSTNTHRIVDVYALETIFLRSFSMPERHFYMFLNMQMLWSTLHSCG